MCPVPLTVRGTEDAPADEDPHEQSALHAVAEATQAYGRRPDGHRAGDNATALLRLMDRLGNPVMYAAVLEGRADVVAFLLSRGADPLQSNRPDPKMPMDTSMRTMAVHQGHQEVVRLLDAAAKGKTRKPRKGKKGRGRK